MVLFANTAGITLTHVPYKGASQAALGVAAGEVPVAFQGLATVTGLVRGGKARLIGVATPAPLPQFPGVPTVSTSGLPGFQFNSWFTVMAPAGTPKEIVARLNAEIRKALDDPEVREKLRDQGLTVRGTSPEELATAMREQLARYARLFKEAGIKGE
jgi:tripartite-type tricarboxylate transporter receptor subunit TctC